MEKPFTLSEGVDSWNTIIFLYNSALKEVRTKVEILNDEFQQVHQYNPIEYIKSRIKTTDGARTFLFRILLQRLAQQLQISCQ